MCVCVCVCVCERGREGGGGGEVIEFQIILLTGLTIKKRKMEGKKTGNSVRSAVITTLSLKIVKQT